MGTIMVVVDDDFKQHFKWHCDDSDISMSGLIKALMKKEMGEPESEPKKRELPVELSCGQCGFKWFPVRTKNPAACPACRSYRWRDERTVRGLSQVIMKAAQKELYLEFDSVWRDAVGKYGTASAVTSLLGTTPEKINEYIKKNKPVTAEQIEAISKLV